MTTNHQQDIDRVLNALGHTAAPTGLEARISSRLRTTAATRTARHSPFAASTSFFAVILNAVKDPRISFAAATRYAAATAALVIASLTLIHHHHNNITTTKPVILSAAVAPLATAQPKDPAAPRPTKTVRHLSTTHPPLCDCDPTALAETLAPSHPAPPMPLTPQERLLVLATRPGSPLEVAELDQLREPILRAAEAAREHNNLRQYMQGLLSPLAAAEALNPPPSDPTPAPDASDPN